MIAFKQVLIIQSQPSLEPYQFSRKVCIRTITIKLLFAPKNKMLDCKCDSHRFFYLVHH